jgi:rod shape-determining protein MreB
MWKDLLNLKLLGKSLAIDLGTTNTVIYRKRAGIVLNMPSVLAVSKKDKRVLAMGHEAKQMLGKTPQNILAIRPLKDGVVADFEITKKMVQYFLRQVQPGVTLFGPRLIIGVPSKATKVEKRALVDIARELGARKVSLVAEPVAAVIGADLPISEPIGNIIVDIGGGTSEAAITSLNGVVVSNAIRIAGDEMDLAIVQHLKDHHNLYIGDQMAERIKMALGYSPSPEQQQTLIVRGRDLNRGFPNEIELTSQDMPKILDPVLEPILDMIEATLEQCPPELANDVMETGVYLAGGGSCLKGLSAYLSERVRLPVRPVHDPLQAVALGLGKLLSDARTLAAVEVTPKSI